MKPNLYAEMRNQGKSGVDRKRKLQDAFGAWDIRSPCTFNCLSQSERQGFESRFGSERKELRQCRRDSAGDVLVVIVFSSKDIDMHSNACVYSKGVQDMGKHFRGQIADLLSLQVKRGDAVRPTGDIDDGSR